jgi:hypothetical protein
MFLGASKRLYNSLRPLVGLSVCRLVPMMKFVLILKLPRPKRLAPCLLYYLKP